MTKDESLRMALENINKAHAKVAALCEGSESWTMSVPPRPDYDHDMVITNALLAAETVINEALAQSEPEPVEWAKFLHYPECWDTAAYPTLHAAIHETLAWSGCSDCTSLEREWVGLTDEEIDKWNIVGHESLREFVRAIEAKLKEKNT